MSPILGFEFYQGPEVKPPLPIDFTLGLMETTVRRTAWANVITTAVQYHDAWGVLIMKPNMDVLLFDARAQSIYDATGWGGTAHLLLTKESR